VVSPRSELGLAPNGSMDDLPCVDQHPQYRACEGFKARKSCKDCHFFQNPHKRSLVTVALPCAADPRQPADPICARYRKADRPARPVSHTG